MHNLTPHQRKIFNYIKKCWKKGYSPSLREIGEKFGTHHNAAYKTVKILEKKGCIERENGKILLPNAIS